MNTLKKDWKPDLGIKHILLVSSCGTRRSIAQSLIRNAFAAALSDRQVLADRAERRVGAERGGGQNAAREIRRLLAAGQNADRDPRSDSEQSVKPSPRRRRHRRRRSTLEEARARQTHPGQEKREDDQGEKAHPEAFMSQLHLILIDEERQCSTVA